MKFLRGRVNRGAIISLKLYRLRLINDLSLILNELNKEEAEWLIESSVKIAEEYQRAFGQLAETKEMNLWWQDVRPRHDFGFTEEDFLHLEDILQDCSDHQVSTFTIPLPTEDGPLKDCLIALTRSTELHQRELQEDAFFYLLENSPYFKARLETISEPFDEP